MFKACGPSGDSLCFCSLSSTDRSFLFTACGDSGGLSMVLTQVFRGFIDCFYVLLTSVGSGFSIASTAITTNKTYINKLNLGVL